MVKQSAQIEYNRTKLAETTLTSSFDGVVIRRSRECGAVVNPGVSTSWKSPRQTRYGAPYGWTRRRFRS